MTTLTPLPLIMSLIAPAAALVGDCPAPLDATYGTCKSVCSQASGAVTCAPTTITGCDPTDSPSEGAYWALSSYATANDAVVFGSCTYSGGTKTASFCCAIDDSTFDQLWDFEFQMVDLSSMDEDLKLAATLGGNNYYLQQFPQSTTLNVEVYGNDGDDSITGSSADSGYLEELWGGDGEDTINGGPGDDVIFGEADADTLIGDVGDDYIRGGGGDDEIDGGLDDDEIWGDQGDDDIDGGGDEDEIQGGIGDDTIDGGDGVDLIYGNDGSDDLFGGAGADVICDTAGTSYCSSGNVLDGGTGADELWIQSVAGICELADYTTGTEVTNGDFCGDTSDPGWSMISVSACSNGISTAPAGCP